MWLEEGKKPSFDQSSSESASCKRGWRENQGTRAADYSSKYWKDYSDLSQLGFYLLYNIVLTKEVHLLKYIYEVHALVLHIIISLYFHFSWEADVLLFTTFILTLVICYFADSDE